MYIQKVYETSKRSSKFRTLDVNGHKREAAEDWNDWSEYVRKFKPTYDSPFGGIEIIVSTLPIKYLAEPTDDGECQ